jgi:5-methylcytosine-specific restriction endonuclease McrA
MYASKRWFALRRQKLLQNPECELGLPGCRGLANEVHHRVAMEDGGAPWEMSNLMSTCKPCHSHLTRREQLDREGPSQGVRTAHRGFQHQGEGGDTAPSAA